MFIASIIIPNIDSAEWSTRDKRYLYNWKRTKKTRFDIDKEFFRQKNIKLLFQCHGVNEEKQIL